MSFREPLDDRQSQAGSPFDVGHVMPGLSEALEHAGLIVLGDTYAVIHDAKYELARGRYLRERLDRSPGVW